jgi:hypothetical protein
MVNMMQEYSVNIIGPDGHLTERIDLLCVDDADALQKAEQLSQGHALVRLWQFDRLIATCRARRSSKAANRDEARVAQQKPAGHGGLLVMKRLVLKARSDLIPRDRCRFGFERTATNLPRWWVRAGHRNGLRRQTLATMNRIFLAVLISRTAGDHGSD